MNEMSKQIKSGTREGAQKSSTDTQPENATNTANEICLDKCSNKSDSTERKPYRVFVSYSHTEKEYAHALITHLEKQGLFPIADREIRIGEAFSEAIREMIECAHVFMPLVTEASNERLWVQQELGYAIALHVPVCPISVEGLPAGMSEHIQSINITKDEWQDLEKVQEIFDLRLAYSTVNDLVQRARKRSQHGRYDCAMFWVERQEILATLTEAACKEGCKLKKKSIHMEAPSEGKKHTIDRDIWRLRERSGFGSFSIPNANPMSTAWAVRDHDRYQTEYERHLLRRERKAMEEYVECFGCDLIIDCAAPEDAANAMGTALRLRLLQDFIKRHNDDRLRIVIPEHEGKMNTTLFIVGDWFATEAVVPRKRGATYDRTMFTRHAPTVLNMIERFDNDFQDYLPKTSGTTKPVDDAKEKALKKLQQSTATINNKLSPAETKQLDVIYRELDLGEGS